MRSRTREGRLAAVLDYEGDVLPEDEPVSHLEDELGLPVCGADPGDHVDGLDCPQCADLACVS